MEISYSLDSMLARENDLSFIKHLAIILLEVLFSYI